jgi:hypothetical protein
MPLEGWPGLEEEAVVEETEPRRLLETADMEQGEEAAEVAVESTVGYMLVAPEATAAMVAQG